MKKMKYKLVLFDLDGTILDTLPDLADGINHMLREFGYEERSYKKIESFIGSGAGHLCFSALPDDDKTRLDEFLQGYREYYAAHSLIKTKPYDGIIELIHALIDNGVEVGVISNKPDGATKRVVAHYVSDKILAVGESELVKRKPSPDGINKVISEIGVDKADVVYIGDSEVDIQTCKNAGVKCISVSWGYRTKEYLKESGAEMIVDSVSELKTVLI